MSKPRPAHQILEDLETLLDMELDADDSSISEALDYSMIVCNPMHKRRFSVDWDIEELPGCCGVGVISDVVFKYDFPKKQNKNKILDLVSEYQEATAKEHYRFGAVIRTHLTSNRVYQNTMARGDYTEAVRFKNPKTKNLITIDVKEL